MNGNIMLKDLLQINSQFKYELLFPFTFMIRTEKKEKHPGKRFEKLE